VDNKEKDAIRAQAFEEAALICDELDKVMRPFGCETAADLATKIRALKKPSNEGTVKNDPV
jgi:protein-arginine kinase activator protein McsA